MAELKLPSGHVALVDDADLELVERLTAMGLRWGVKRNKKTGQVYVHGNVVLHKLLMPGVPIVDHANRNGLDNRRENLRPATASQNGANRSRLKNNTSGYKGVTYDASSNKNRPWRAQVNKDGAHKHLGWFATPEEAARAYDRYALERWGEYACLNFPTGPGTPPTRPGADPGPGPSRPPPPG